MGDDESLEANDTDELVKFRTQWKEELGLGVSGIPLNKLHTSPVKQPNSSTDEEPEDEVCWIW